MIYDQTYNGSLSATDCPATNGAYSDIYTFQGFAQQQIAVEMTAGTFDTLLYLYDPSGAPAGCRRDDANILIRAFRAEAISLITLPSTGTHYVVPVLFRARVTAPTRFGAEQRRTVHVYAIAYGTRSRRDEPQLQSVRRWSLRKWLHVLAQPDSRSLSKCRRQRLIRSCRSTIPII